MFKRLNERLEKFLEGQVVSFQDFKNKKQGKTPFYITIKQIELGACEGRIDETIPLGDHTPGRRFYYEQFQDWLYKNDFFCTKEDEMFKCNFTMTLEIDKAGIKKEEVWDCRFDVGNGNVNLFEYIQARLSAMYRGIDEPIEFTQEEQLPDDYQAEYDSWEHKIQREQPQQPDFCTPVKRGKESIDVQVGDILQVKWGYSMILVDFYKVVQRKKASIVLAKLDTAIVSGDGMQGTCKPVNKIVPSNEVNGKIFRIMNKPGFDCVCKIDGQYAYYWYGDAVSFDRLD